MLKVYLLGGCGSFFKRLPIKLEKWFLKTSNADSVSKLHCIVYFNWVLTEKLQIFSLSFSKIAIKKISFSQNRWKINIYFPVFKSNKSSLIYKIAKNKPRKYLTAFKTTWWYNIVSQFFKTISIIIYYSLK